MIRLRAIFLIPVAFAGAFTVMILELPVRTWADVVVPVFSLGPIYLGVFLVRRWMWRQPSDRRYLRLTRGTWFFLILAAYAAGAGIMLWA